MSHPACNLEYFKLLYFFGGQSVNMISVAHKPKMTPSSYGNIHVLILLWPKETNMDIMFIPIYQTAVGTISPAEIAKEASNLQCKLWENRDLTLRPVFV
jgi:hypothetical protein